MLKGLKIELGKNGAIINGSIVNRQQFYPWDCKSFDPCRDDFIIRGITDALKSNNERYLLGLPCTCCADHNEVMEIREKSSATLTWANLFVNGNYTQFIENVFPLIQSLPVMVAVNHASSHEAFSSCLKHLRFDIPDNVLQGANETVNRFLDQCSHLNAGTIVLVGASAVAKIMIHKAFILYPQLSFIDIGTTLNPLLGLGMGRDYLRSYWSNSYNLNSAYANKICIW